MGAMIELLLLATVVSVAAGRGIVVVLDMVKMSEWGIRWKQRQNAKLITSSTVLECKEHNRVFRCDELVARGKSLYCPECYKQYVFAASTSSPFVMTDLGEIHKELGSKPKGKAS